MGTDKKLIVFDLDGTLTESKQDLEPAMRETLVKLLEQKLVAIIGGGKFEQFQKQLLGPLAAPEALLTNLFLFPTDGAAFYRFVDSAWQQVYQENLTAEEKQKVLAALARVLQELNYIPPPTLYGEQIEDRGGQITFSALGQQAPLAEKEKWQEGNNQRRLKLAERLQAKLPDFTVRPAGLTSIDVTRKGIDKAHGLRQMEKYLDIPLTDMLFVGDALFPGGNDYAVVPTGVEYLIVGGPLETKTVIRQLLE